MAHTVANSVWNPERSNASSSLKTLPKLNWTRRVKEKDSKDFKKYWEVSKQVFSPIWKFCKPGDQKRTFLKKWNYRYGKNLKLEIKPVEDLTKKVAEQRNDAEICAFVADSKIRERSF